MLEEGARPTKGMAQPFERDDAANEAAGRSSLPTTPKHFGVFTRALAAADPAGVRKVGDATVLAENPIRPTLDLDRTCNILH
jgi:hypothetical protein